MALDEVERLVAAHQPVSEIAIRRIHALVMGGGRTRVKPTPYRDGQNVIRDARTQAMVYLPPEAKDVPALMAALVKWINQPDDLPVPLRAGIAHYQFATIHPYFDGNGRTARLLTTLILRAGGYDLKGLYSLEEYYALDLGDYYAALTVGPSHNYYLGRTEADITAWVAYFVQATAASFEKVQDQAAHEAGIGTADQDQLLRELDAKQRKALVLFQRSREITARNVGQLFGYSPRTASALCRRWVEKGFLVVANPAKKSRRYRLNDDLEVLMGAKS
jgi:Fic family protein